MCLNGAGQQRDPQVICGRGWKINDRMLTQKTWSETWTSRHPRQWEWVVSLLGCRVFRLIRWIVSKLNDCPSWFVAFICTCLLQRDSSRGRHREKEDIKITKEHTPASEEEPAEWDTNREGSVTHFAFLTARRVVLLVHWLVVGMLTFRQQLLP